MRGRSALEPGHPLHVFSWYKVNTVNLFVNTLVSGDSPNDKGYCFFKGCLPTGALILSS